MFIILLRNENAQKYLAPALGLKEFSLARTREETKIEKMEKEDAAMKFYSLNVPIIWLDDSLDDFQYSDGTEGDSRNAFRTKWLSRKQTLLIAPCEYTGLEPQHFEVIDSFINDPNINVSEINKECFR